MSGGETSVGVWLLAGALLCAALAPASAAVYPLPPPGDDVVGEVSTTTVRAGETLIDIARDRGLGYNAVVAANPGLDPWLPEVGATVVLPTRHVLPSTPREGIIVNLAEMRLYHYPAPEPGAEPVVMTYPIGIGRDGWTTPLGITRIVAKAEDPPWVVPASVRREHAAEGNPLPAVVPPGPDNPLGRHALRLGWTSYLIHGTNRPFGIGMRVSHGCIRMYPDHVERVFQLAPVGTPVWVIDQPLKIGRAGDELVVEVHSSVAENAPPPNHLSTVRGVVEALMPAELRGRALAAARVAAAETTGLPVALGSLARIEPLEVRGWMLQLGAFADRRNASRLLRDLSGEGLPVSVRGHDSGLCHVMVGPYGDRLEAETALEDYRLRAGGVGEVLPADRPGALGECVL